MFNMEFVERIDNNYCRYRLRTATTTGTGYIYLYFTVYEPLTTTGYNYA